jgi:hypothetical protein
VLGDRSPRMMAGMALEGRRRGVREFRWSGAFGRGVE